DIEQFIKKIQKVALKEKLNGSIRLSTENISVIVSGKKTSVGKFKDALVKESKTYKAKNISEKLRKSPVKIGFDAYFTDLEKNKLSNQKYIVITKDHTSEL